MCQEKEEDDLPVLKTVLMHHYNDSNTTEKSLGEATSNNIDNTRRNRTEITNQQTNKQKIKKHLWTFLMTNKQHLTRENEDVAKKGKPKRGT